jgi:diaminopimelate decarboxylase
MAASEANPKPLPAGMKARNLEAVAQKFGTPYQLYEEGSMVDNVKHLISEFKAAGFDFTQFYAVKALPNPAVLKLLVDAGCGLDCSSTAELYIARKLGVPGNKIMYTSNYTSAVRHGHSSILQRQKLRKSDLKYSRAHRRTWLGQ